MLRYVAKRLVVTIPTLVGMSILIFLLIRVVPGDPALAMLGGQGEVGRIPEAELAALRADLGLDRPLLVQYMDWISGVARGDLGHSYWTKEPVSRVILDRLPLTLELASLSFIIGLLIAFPVGILSAIKHNSLLDYFLRVFSILGLAIPSFWLGLLVLMVLIGMLSWQPSITRVSLFTDPVGHILQLIFPALILGFNMSAPIARMIRSTMLEVLREDYITTARSKGLPERTIIFRHAMKNALLPPITIIGILIAGLVSGVVVIEVVFNLPGLGRFLVDAIFRRDYIVVQNMILFIGATFALVNLVVDVSYAWLDPRIRY
jgi:peptide/nickel transport system permease protein